MMAWLSGPKILRLKYGLYKRGALRLDENYRENISKSSDELISINWSKRLACFEHAIRYVPFYREFYAQHGIQHGDIKRQEDWDKLPVLEKEHIRKAKESLIADGVSKTDLQEATTGGSTGEPLTVYLDKRFPREVLSWRMQRLWGLEPGCNAAYIWRMVRPNPISELVNKMLWWPTKRIRLDAATMTPDSMSTFIEQLRSVKPDLIQGYVGSVENVADYILDQDINIPHPKAVWVTSSPLSKLQKQKMHEAFQSPVYDQYGCCEVPYVAYEIPGVDGLMVDYDAVHIDFVEDSDRAIKQSVEGDILLTPLWNYAFPLIRYRVGDRGHWLKPPENGSFGMPIMSRVKGRTTDLIHIPGGPTLGGDFLTTIFDPYPRAVKRFQVRQSEDGSVDIFVIPNKAYRNYKNEIALATSKLQSYATDKLSIRTIEVDKIDDIKGKVKFVISEYQSNS
jgi:phenylacetate-CoA ligase